MTESLTWWCPRRYPRGASIDDTWTDTVHILTGHPADVTPAIEAHAATCRAEPRHEPVSALTDTELAALIEDRARTRGLHAAIDDGAAALAASRNGDHS